MTSLEEKRSEAEQKLEEAKEKELEAQRLLEEAKEKLERQGFRAKGGRKGTVRGFKVCRACKA